MYGDPNCVDRGPKTSSQRRISLPSEAACEAERPPSNLSGGASILVQKRSQTQIAEAFDRLQNLVTCFSEATSILEKRLSVILRPHEVSDGVCGSDKAKTAEPLCDLAAALRNITERLNGSLTHIHSITGRVEL